MQHGAEPFEQQQFVQLASKGLSQRAWNGLKAGLWTRGWRSELGSWLTSTYTTEWIVTLEEEPVVRPTEMWAKVTTEEERLRQSKGRGVRLAKLCVKFGQRPEGIGAGHFTCDEGTTERRKYLLPGLHGQRSPDLKREWCFGEGAISPPSQSALG